MENVVLIGSPVSSNPQKWAHARWEEREEGQVGNGLGAGEGCFEEVEGCSSFEPSTSFFYQVLAIM